MQNCHTVDLAIGYFPLLPSLSNNPLPSSFSQLILLNWGSREKWIIHPQSWSKRFLWESGQQPASVSTQNMHNTKNKVITVYGFAAGGNQVDDHESRSTCIDYFGAYRRASTRSPRGKVCRVCVCTHMKPAMLDVVLKVTIPSCNYKYIADDMVNIQSLFHYQFIN